MADDKIQLEGESQSFVDYVNYVGGVDLSKPLDVIRQANEEAAQKLKGDFLFTGTKEDRLVPAADNGVEYAIPITILNPPVASAPPRKRNIMVYYHGGGWTWSSRMTHMKLCEMIASSCQCVVVNVEYRLSPEHKFPACYRDAEAVVRWCVGRKQELTGSTDALLGVAGDSAGGNMAASVCHLVPSGTLDYQVLIYSSFTVSRSLYPSYRKYGNGYLLSEELMLWFTNNFLNNMEEAANVICSPMHRDSFTGLPPALFVVAECDPLADQSPAYQKKLEDAGVATDFTLLKGTVHGFVSKPGHFKKTTERTVEIIAQFVSKL